LRKKGFNERERKSLKKKRGKKKGGAVP